MYSQVWYVSTLREFTPSWILGSFSGALSLTIRNFNNGLNESPEVACEQVLPMGGVARNHARTAREKRHVRQHCRSCSQGDGGSNQKILIEKHAPQMSCI